MDKWKTSLCNSRALDKFAEVLEGLCNGFSIDLDFFNLHQTFIPLNYYKIQEAHNFIEEKYSKEIELSQVSPGFIFAHAELLFGPIQTAPLTIILSMGSKLCIILGLSYF